MNTYCTIVDENYLAFAYALYDSIANVTQEEFRFCVLISNRRTSDKKNIPVKDNVTFVFIDEICRDGIGKNIYEKYFTEKINSFRWSMKPVLIRYLLDHTNAEKVICTDCDVRFFNDPGFLFKLLDENHVLLSPHFRSSDPVNNTNNFILQYNSGIFNGGFIAASKFGKDAMDWWARACASFCEYDPCKGQYFDQVHLNLLPVYFDKVHILKHRGCNVANWNLQECKRTLNNSNEVLIDNKYPVIFIHFTKSMMLAILRGEDKHLYDFFVEYSTNVKKYNPQIDLMDTHLKFLDKENLSTETIKPMSPVKRDLFSKIIFKIKSFVK